MASSRTQVETSTGRQRLRKGTILTRRITLALMTLMIGIVLAACGGGSDAPTPSEPTVAPEPTAAQESTAVTTPAESTDTPVPPSDDPAPSFTFTLFQGQDVLGDGPLTPGDLQGKPLVINFWAGLCPPCRAELPDFQEFYEEFGDRVNLVGVDLGQFTGLGSLQDAKGLLEELERHLSGSVHRRHFSHAGLQNSRAARDDVHRRRRQYLQALARRS